MSGWKMRALKNNGELESKPMSAFCTITSEPRAALSISALLASTKAARCFQSLQVMIT